MADSRYKMTETPDIHYSRPRLLCWPIPRFKTMVGYMNPLSSFSFVEGMNPIMNMS